MSVDWMSFAFGAASMLAMLGLLFMWTVVD